MSQKHLDLVFGGAIFGKEGSLFTRVSDVPVCQRMVDLFFDKGGKAIDTSNGYGNGTSEEWIAKLDLKGGTVDTKAYPFAAGAHSAEKLRAAVEESAEKLKPHKISTLYLHFPDRSVPYEETVREINELHKRGLFSEFGLSNFEPAEVQQIYELAKNNGWVLPAVYQGKYNAIERQYDAELLPLLRKLGIRFDVYSPLASGLLAGKILSKENMDNNQGRFSTSVSHTFADVFKGMYAPLVSAVAQLHEDLHAAGNEIPMSEIALRWIHFHSALKASNGDRLIIGPSSFQQLESTLKANEGGPLPDNIVKLLDKAWNAADEAAKAGKP